MFVYMIRCSGRMLYKLTNFVGSVHTYRQYDAIRSLAQHPTVSLSFILLLH